MSKKLKQKLAEDYMRSTCKERPLLPFEDVYNRAEDFLAGFEAAKVEFTRVLLNSHHLGFIHGDVQTVKKCFDDLGEEEV